MVVGVLVFALVYFGLINGVILVVLEFDCLLSLNVVFALGEVCCWWCFGFAICVFSACLRWGVWFLGFGLLSVLVWMID